MTVKIRNVSPYGGLDTPLLQQCGVVELGEVVDVTEDQAQRLLAQFENWAPVDKAAIVLCAAAVAEQNTRHLEASNEPAPDALKPEWVAYAAAQGDPDPGSKRKADLVAEYGTVLPDPAEAAAAMAERGAEIAASAAAAASPPLTPPTDPDPGEGQGTANGDQS